MELHLDPVIPVTRVVNGHNVFNKGYHHGIRGKTYEEFYGEEKARKKRESISRKLKGHPFWGNRKARAKPCVAIKDGRIVARFPSAKAASEYVGVNEATVRKYINGVVKCPPYGLRWFYEGESWKWGELIST